MGEEAKQEQAKADTQPEPVAEEKKEEKAAEEEKKEEAKPPSPFVLFVDLHCVGCAKKIEKSIMRIRGVEGVTIAMAQNQVTIKGIVEPQAVCAKIMKKTKRRAKVLSPLPAAEGEPVPEVITSQVSGLTTVELNVNMHCEACADQLKRKILKMRGVQTAVTELSTEKVTVTGTMDANKLVDYVYRRTKKQAKIVPQPEPEPVLAPEKQEEKKEAEEKPPEEEAKPKGEEKPPEEARKEENESNNNNKGEEIKEEPKMEGGENNNSNNTDEENTKRMMYYYQPLYVIERIPPPQLFSDENPNACCIS
ncbi:heavy metal-associated isoprenylated plant protein 9 [Citrus sinensis]|uniref:heavy metal-associated isoprenylated plant protein 9 n=1 Tax=Citrus sinensis TaxID=2711 RepID=UPI000CED492E|nr:heavy metal-associated isoprenylated plant protein 9 [Citrus sinensis]XP_024043282.1 heavy metal-associated isoprenylated plant protein 9 [Citrus x clementina]KAH9724453.1 heavy metal-associated isoprenylated plant protein 9 [Citrus sinensis]